MSEDGFQFPLEFLILFIQDIQLDPNDFSEDAKVSYENAKTISAEVVISWMTYRSHGNQESR